MPSYGILSLDENVGRNISRDLKWFTINRLLVSIYQQTSSFSLERDIDLE